MAFDYGTKTEPGIVTNVDSALSVTASGEAPADVGIIGQADLSVGTADPNAVYRVTRASDARTYFGDDSFLTDAVLDALQHGAYPVYAVATEMVSGTEDLSSISSYSGTLNEDALSENPEDTTFTINGTDLATVHEYGDVSALTPDAGEVLLDPTTGDYHIDGEATVGNSSDQVAFTSADYASALSAMREGASGAIDFLVPLNEADSVTNDAQGTLSTMEQNYNFALGIFGAAAGLDPANYTSPYDDSRVQLIYPTRQADGSSVLGAYAGLRASLGIQTTPINKRLSLGGDLIEDLTLQERGDLIDARVTPLAPRNSGARVADDVNTVSDDNSEEAAIRYGFDRLVMDYVINTIRLNEQPFIGRLNSESTRSALEGLLSNQLKTMTRSNAIQDFDVRVTKIDATTAAVDVSIKTASPLRFIENTVTIGQ